MKRTMIAIPVVALTGVLFLGTSFRGENAGIVARVHAEDHERCRNASLQGAYGFLRTGTNNVLGGPIAAVGVVLFDGQGTATETADTNSRNGVITRGGTPLPPSPYVVNADCTGSFLDNQGVAMNDFVVVNGGKEFLLISTQPGRIVTAIGKKL